MEDSLVEKAALFLGRAVVPCHRKEPHGMHNWLNGSPLDGRNLVYVVCTGIEEPEPEPETAQELEPLPSSELEDSDAWYILQSLLPEVANRMQVSAEHYGLSNHRALGAAGQFADIWRKVGPLKRALWDGQQLPRESPREILMDLVGHCLLTVAMIDREVPIRGDFGDPNAGGATEYQG